nr:DNA internalization-related competence protein ComEC/Rec2 [Paenibacillus sediminis]
MTICWVVGSSLAYFYNISTLLFIWIGILLVSIASWILQWVHFKLLFIMWCMLIFAGLYWEWNDARNVSLIPSAAQQSADELHKSAVSAEGTIASALEIDGDRVDFTMEVTALSMGNKQTANKNSSLSKLTSKEKVIVQVRLAEQKELEVVRLWKRGQHVQMQGILERPSEGGNFGGFNYRNYLHLKSIHWLIKVKGTANVRISPALHWSVHTIFAWNDSIRSFLGETMDKLFDGRNAGYMKGLVIGISDDLDPETFAHFSKLGLTHVLAISGMHVAVYVGTLLFVLRRFRLTRETSLTIVIMLVPCYVLITGASPSVIRAGIMSMIGLYAARRGLLKDGLNILCASLLLLMFWNPYFLLNVSFQLSYIVTAGLIIFVPRIYPLLSSLPKGAAGAASVTLAAQLISFPLTIYYFNQFSWLSFIANFILVSFISCIVMPLGMASMLFGIVWISAGKCFAKPAEWLNEITFWLVEWLNQYDQFVMIWPSPSLAWILCYYVLLYLILLMANRSKKSGEVIPTLPDETAPLTTTSLMNGAVSPRNRKAALMGSLLLIGFFRLLYTGYQQENMHGAGLVQFLDVGQGDSILVTTPSGLNMLVDTGGTVHFQKEDEEWRERKDPFEVGKKVVVPLLKKRGVHELEAVVLTHGDQDHIGGMLAVLENIPVRRILFNGTLSGTEVMEQIMTVAIDKHIPLYAVHEDLELKLDKYTRITFLYPETREQESSTIEKSGEQNKHSIVMKMEMNRGLFLLTGDVESEGEQYILQNMNSSISSFSSSSSSHRVDIMKIAHHGSKTSTSEAWLKYWRPRVSVISVGASNTYGHPNPTVVNRISNEGSLIYRTDLHGEVQMKVKDGEFWVRTKRTAP